MLNLIEGVQFDTIYHEHFSYLSALALIPLFARHGLTIFDVQEIPTHGGSLRIFVGHTGRRTVEPSVKALIEKERAHRLDRIETYTNFREEVERVKRDFLEFLIDARRAGKSVGGSPAPLPSRRRRCSTLPARAPTSSASSPTRARTNRVASSPACACRSSPRSTYARNGPTMS